MTLPALWLLGCRLPCVVINAGCAREPAGWLWPTGVVVVLVTGGRDKICNEYARWPEERARGLWSGIEVWSHAAHSCGAWGVCCHYYVLHYYSYLACNDQFGDLR